MKYIHIIILAVLLAACGGGNKTSSLQTGGDTVAFKYATQISVVKYDGFSVATINNPWKYQVAP